MKFIVITVVLGAALIAPAMAQQAQQAPQTQTRQGWGRRCASTRRSTT
jgi:invasion protein IalB